MIIQSTYVMLPGASGLRWIPRKMAGIAMITMEPSMVAIVMLSVVLDRAIHLYLSGCPSVAGSCIGSRRDITPTRTSLPRKGCLLATTYPDDRRGAARRSRA